jgi:K+-sensing histidine kinase KdpD
VEKLRDPEQTDELRRLAVQLALQLPASVSDARRVLALTSECLDEFLIEKPQPSAAARASRIWSRPRPMVTNATPLTSPPRRLAVFLCCLGVLSIAAVLGGLALRLVGYGAVGANVLGVVAVALLFGRGAALMSAALAFLLMNWAVVPPAWDLSLPTTYELCGGVMYGVAAIVVPWIQARREPLRRATLTAVERPLRVLMRRAA